MFAGILKTSPAFNKAMWNEYGFHDVSGDVVKRPLFTPLAAKYQQELISRIEEATRASNR